MDAIQHQIIGHLAMNPDGLTARELQESVVPTISQPTLWRRLDDLRAAGRVLRVGRGRATRYLGASSDHAIADLRSKALHMAVGRKLLRQPELIEQARRNLARMRVAAPYADTYVNRWDRLLSGPLESVLEVLGADDEGSKALRHASPFAGLLSQEERLAVFRRCGLRH